MRPGLGPVRVKAIDEASEREVRNLQLERWSIRVVRIIVTQSTTGMQVSQIFPEYSNFPRVYHRFPGLSTPILDLS